MPPPIDDQTRARIVELARAGTSRNETARQAGVSTSTVSRVALAEGVSFDRSRTKRATEAARADAHARRVQVASGLLDDLADVRGTLRGHLADPQGLMYVSKAVSALVSAYARLAALDADDPTGAAVDAWLDYVTGGAP